jgi:hypothetical protein
MPRLQWMLKAVKIILLKAKKPFCSCKKSILLLQIIVDKNDYNAYNMQYNENAKNGKVTCNVVAEMECHRLKAFLPKLYVKCIRELVR